MAISKLNFNSLNVTPTASKGIGFDSGADDLEASFSGGSMVFIKKLTASSSATLSFVDGSDGVVLDDTYKEYVFTFKNIHPATDNSHFTFNASKDDSSHNYDVTKTTTQFRSLNAEADNDTNLQYFPGHDLAQSTAFQTLISEIGNGNDETASGTMSLFNPSSTTFVKHYMSRLNSYASFDYSIEQYSAGYGNTTSAIDAVQFKMSTGDIDAGTITLYGIN